MPFALSWPWHICLQVGTKLLQEEKLNSTPPASAFSRLSGVGSTVSMAVIIARVILGGPLKNFFTKSCKTLRTAFPVPQFKLINVRSTLVCQRPNTLHPSLPSLQGILLASELTEVGQVLDNQYHWLPESLLWPQQWSPLIRQLLMCFVD